jgi:hypothetical protein
MHCGGFFDLQFPLNKRIKVVEDVEALKVVSRE